MCATSCFPDSSAALRASGSQVVRVMHSSGQGMLSWPTSLRPQPSTWPFGSRAYWSPPPDETATTPAPSSAFTSFGTSWFSPVYFSKPPRPLPRTAKALLPHALTVPSFINAVEYSPPLDIDLTPLRPLTETWVLPCSQVAWRPP